MKHTILFDNIVQEIDFPGALYFALSTGNHELTAKILVFEGYSNEFMRNVIDWMKIIENDSASLEEAKAKRDAEEAEEFGYNYNGFR